MNNYYSNFQRFDHKGSRLSIFGTEKEGMLQVFILKCSTKDLFFKKLSKDLYEYFYEKNIKNFNKLFPEYHPVIHNIVIEEGNTAKYTFELFCNLYYKKYTTRIKDNHRFSSVKFEYQYLQCENNIIPIKNSLKFVK